jgi:hypothetical protein
MGARAGASVGGYGSAALFLISRLATPSPGGPMAVSPALVARLFGNGTKVGRRETSPKGSCRVECCRGAIPHPKVLHQHVVGDTPV